MRTRGNTRRRVGYDRHLNASRMIFRDQRDKRGSWANRGRSLHYILARYGETNRPEREYHSKKLNRATQMKAKTLAQIVIAWPSSMRGGSSIL